MLVPFTKHVPCRKDDAASTAQPSEAGRWQAGRMQVLQQLLRLLPLPSAWTPFGAMAALLVVLLPGCGHQAAGVDPAPPDPIQTQVPALEPISPVGVETAVESDDAHEKYGLSVVSARELDDARRETGFDGTFVLLDPQEGSLLVSNPQFLDEGFPPASTFKMLNSMIALETGVASGPDFELPWDKKVRFVDSWNQDHTLASAFSVSAYWFYQEIARRIGPQRMALWVDACDYGNESIGGPIDEFWLHGDLRISPRQQVEFLRRLHDRALPLSPATMETFIDEIGVWERNDDWVAWAKTGWAIREGSERFGGYDHVGWFVGWLQKDERVYYFASLLLASEAVVEERTPSEFRRGRIRVVLTNLQRLGIVDEWPEPLLRQRARLRPSPWRAHRALAVAVVGGRPVTSASLLDSALHF